MCVDIFIQYIIKYIIQKRKKIKTINMETNKNMETINKAINSLFAIQKQLKKSQLLDQSQHNSLEEISINIEKIQHHINEKANDEDETRVKTNVEDPTT